MAKYNRPMKKKQNHETGSDNNADDKTISVWTVIFLIIAFVVVIQVVLNMFGFEACENTRRLLRFGPPSYECLDSD